MVRGIKANMEMVPGSSAPKFTYPLVITEVKPGTEAEMLGLKVRDVVVAIKTPDQPDFKFVPQHIASWLSRGMLTSRFGTPSD